MRIKEEKVLVEAKKMLGRIGLFNIIRDTTDEFKAEAEELEQLVKQYEAGEKNDICEIEKRFGEFSEKYKKYIEENF